MSDLSLLMDMGFPQTRAEKALSVTGNKGVEPAMEWLLAHSDANETSPENVKPEGGSELTDVMEDVSDEIKNVQDLTDEFTDQAKSLQCDECSKKFRTDSEVEFHAVKTGHQSFSESSEEIKPLTEEEKKERVKKIENLIKQRRAEKAEQEKRDTLEKEKSRRKTGQELAHVRQKMQDEEIKQLAELKKREKLEEKQARQRVLEQIEKDKQARREKFGMGASTAPAATPSIPSTLEAVTVSSATSSQTYDECRIQVRLTNGECLTHKFSPKEELAAVRLFVQMNRTDGSEPFALMTNFPKKVFSEEDMNAPLSTLGLVPSAVLIVCKPPVIC